MSTILAMSGSGAYYVRKSTKKQDEASQVDAIGRWLASKGRNVKECLPFEDVGSRHKSEKRADFQRLLKWIEKGTVQWVVVAELDRFGTKDAYELMHFLHQLRQAHCQLWVAADDQCVSEGDEVTVFKNVIKGIGSEKEQFTRSDRALRNFPQMAARGEFTGGRVPYAFDVVCRRGDTLRWRFVPQVGGGTEVRDGKEEQVPKLPPHDHKAGERKYLVPTTREDRLDALRQMFRWFATEVVSYSEIARRLNDAGVDASPYPKWSHDRIITTLSNPIYASHNRPLGKTTQSQFKRNIFDSNTGGFTIGVAPDKSGRKVDRPREEWIIPKQAAFEPLVSRDIFDRVQEKIADQKVRRAPRTDRCWLRGILVCDRCGMEMWAWGQGKKERGTSFPSYKCQTADRAMKGRLTNESGCALHKIRHDRLQPFVEEFLRGRGESLESIVAARGDRGVYDALVKKEDETAALLKSIRSGIDHFVRRTLQKDGSFKFTDKTGEHVAEIMPSEPYIYTIEEFRETWGSEPVEDECFTIQGDVVHVIDQDICVDGEWNEWSSFDIYDRLHLHAMSRLVVEVEGMEVDLRNMVTSYRTLRSDRAREIANDEMETLEAAIKSRRADMVNLSERSVTLADELERLSDRVKEALIALKAGTDTQRADAARRVFKEIRLGFTHRSPKRDRKTKRKTFVYSDLASVKIIPQVGEPEFVELKNSCGGSAWPAGAHRHRG